MAKQPPKPPAVRLSGAQRVTPNSKRRFLTSTQLAQMRLKRADLEAKLRQMTWAEHERRR